MTAGPGWARPPLSPELEPGEVAVWRLDRAASHPIETVLARYLGGKPGSLLLRRSPAGKPELAGSPFRVSLAHSGDVSLVGVVRDREIGVDVERFRAGAERWLLIGHALTARERAKLAGLPAARQADAFLSIWTRKEAVLKAAGVGLAVDPGLIEVEEQAVVSAPPKLGPARDWTLLGVSLPGHAAAVALRGPVSRLLLWDTR